MFNYLKTTIEPAFRMEEDDGGLPPSAVDLLDPIDESAGSEETETTESEETPTPAAGGFNFDYEKLAAAVKSGLPQPVAEQKQITAEEAAKLLNFWEPGDEWFQQFGNMETQKQAVLAMRDGLARQFVTIMQHMLQDHGTTLRGEFDPIRNYVTEQQVQQRETRFNTAYPQLANPALSPVIGAVINQLAQTGALKGKPEAEQFKAIAAGVEAVIKTQNPAFVLTKPAAKGGTKPGHAIPVTTPGGGGSGGGGRGGAQPTSTKTKAVSLLG